MAYASTLTLDRAVMKQNDTYPNMTITLADTNGPIDLTTATSVVLFMRGNKTNTLVTNACTIDNAAHGEVHYVFSSGDTATPDSYQVEAEVTWTGGGKQTVPNQYLQNPTLQIDQQLDSPTG